LEIGFVEHKLKSL